MKTSSRVVCAFLITFVFLSLRVWSQVATTSLRGTLSDVSGALVTGASLTLTRPDTGFTVTMKSNSAGAYIFQQLDPGTYQLTADASGFAAQTVQVQLLVDQPATLNLTMNVAKSETTIAVQAQTTLNTTDASIGNAVGNELVQALP